MAERARLATILVGRFAARTARAVAAPARLVGRMRMRPPDRMKYVLPDIRTPDATRAEDIYAGYFAFGGRIVNTQGRSPFDLPPPSKEWAHALNGFAWLRHLGAADTHLARVNARALVTDYLASRARNPAAARDPATTARRILSWLSQSGLLLEGAEADFYHRLLRALARDAADLQQAYGAMVGVARLQAAVALSAYAMCAATPQRHQARATAQVADELDRQIYADGGHVSRNPQVMLDLLCDLLPLRQVYAAAQTPLPALLNAVDRIMPALRLLRHGEGSLALFNGMGVTPLERLATALRYDDSRGPPPMSAPHCGYQRLEAANAVVIVDCGPPPPGPFSVDAHAGCLSFELSSGAQRIVVNCGAPAVAGAAREAARQTAAHSTLVIDDVSSCRIAPDVGIERVVAGQIVSGPRDVGVARKETSDGQALELSHDGYAQRFGLVHERLLALRSDGARLVGRDRLSAARQSAHSRAEIYALRFHLHPSVVVTRAGEGAALALDLPDGQRWIFEAGGAPVSVEESVFYAANDGMRACEQIVVRGPAEATMAVKWSFSRI